MPATFTARVAIEAVAAVFTVASLCFYFLSAIAIGSFLGDRRRKRRQAALEERQLPPVSILKPLKGADPGIWESFCSHCDQDYPEFELIFGVSDSSDPAIEVVHRLQAKYPKLRIESIVCDRVLGTNIKVSNLAQMLPAARHEILLVNDSDIRVPPDYLREAIAPLADSFVGLVTCLYRAVAGPTIGSRLEALGIGTDFVPGILSARFLEKGLRFGLGSTLAFRRRDLEAIGGFEALVDYLADDYELGRRIARTGKRVELSAATVETFLPAYTLREFFRHQMRWSRTIRDARRWGYAGLVFTFGLPWALLTLLAARGAAWAWVLFALTLAARLGVGFAASEMVLDGRQNLGRQNLDRKTFRNAWFRDILLLPLRDPIAPVVWVASFMGSRIHWRGDVFNLKDGRLTKVSRPGLPGLAHLICHLESRIIERDSCMKIPAVSHPGPEAAIGAPSRPLSRKSSLVSILGIVLVWAAIYAAGMFTPALLDDVDTVHDEAAREMLTRHDWVTLHTDGIRYLEKAPLMYWAVAADYKLFGISEWSSRFPRMLGVLLGLLAVYVLGRRYYGEAGGFYSAIVLGTCIGPYIFTRFEIPDAIVGLWLTLTFYFFLRSVDEATPSRLACWGFAAVCALNVLTKGLVGLVFPAAAIGLFVLLTGRFRNLPRMRPISSLLVFLAIAAPWHVLAALRNPSQGAARGFLWFYFVNEHFLRYVNKRVPPGYDTVPLLIFWGLLMVWLLPWAVFLPQAVRDVPHRWRDWRSELTPTQRANLLFALWALAIVLFFSFSTRQEYYTIPAVPALALLVGGWLARESSADRKPQDRRAGKISAIVLFAAGAIGAAAGLFLLLSSRVSAPGSDLADLLAKHSQDYDFSLGHILDLTPEAMGAFRGPLLGTAIALLLGSGSNWLMRWRGRPKAGNFALIVMMVALLACVHAAFVTFSPILSSKPLAVAIERIYKPGDAIVVDGEYHQASTLNFYTGIPLRVLHEPSGNLWNGAKFPDAPHVFETQASLELLWTGPHRVFLWTDEPAPKALQGLPRYLVARSGGKSILTNRKPDD